MSWKDLKVAHSNDISHISSALADQIGESFTLWSAYIHEILVWKVCYFYTATFKSDPKPVLNCQTIFLISYKWFQDFELIQNILNHLLKNWFRSNLKAILTKDSEMISDQFWVDLFSVIMVISKLIWASVSIQDNFIQKPLKDK